MPGGRVGAAEGGSARGSEGVKGAAGRSLSFSCCLIRAIRATSCYLSSCWAGSRPSRRCCRPAGRRWSCPGRSPHERRRCGWRQRKPSRRTPSPGAASSPDRRRRHSQRHGSASLPGGWGGKREGVKQGCEAGLGSRGDAALQLMEIILFSFTFSTHVCLMAAVSDGGGGSIGSTDRQRWWDNPAAA